MNGLKQEQYNMLNVTFDFMNEPTTLVVTESIDDIEPVVTILGEKLGEIEDVKIRIAKSTKGKRALIESLKKGLSYECAGLEKIVHAYAAKTENVELFNNTKRPYSFFHSKRHSALPAVAQALHELVHGIITVTPPTTNPLAGSGVDAARLTAFQTNITNYSNSVPGTRNAIAAKSADIDYLDTLIDKAIALLKEQLDALMYQFSTADSSLFTNYQKARKLTDAYTVHSGFKGTIVDANTGTSLIGIATGKAESATVSYDDMKFDSKTGLWTVATPAFDETFTLTFEAPGYQKKQIPDQTTARGEKKVVIVEMIPAAGL